MYQKNNSYFNYIVLRPRSILGALRSAYVVHRLDSDRLVHLQKYKEMYLCYIFFTKQPISNIFLEQIQCNYYDYKHS